MSDSQQVFERLSECLGYAGSPGLVAASEGPSTLERLLHHAGGSADERRMFYFVGGQPMVMFAVRDNLDRARRGVLHQRVWNDGRIPLLVCVGSDRVHVYNAFALPTSSPAQLDEDEDRLLFTLESTADFLDELHVIERRSLDAGATWKTEFGRRFRPKTRCDATLLANLQEARRILGQQGLTVPAIHRLLLRSIFVLYLERRGVLDSTYYDRHHSGARSLLDCLQSKKVAEGLFDALAGDFNGDLFPVDEVERRETRDEHYRTLHRFLSGREQLTRSQMWLWPLYDFSVIPIHLVGTIYELFLKSGGVSDGGDESVGQHYTPHTLVELVLDEVLPRSSDLSLPRIIDPACGSGAFLVEAFRRLTERWSRAHGRAPDFAALSELVKERIFGVDSNGDAVRIAAFSLYLSLVDHLAQGESLRSSRLPTLVGKGPDSKANLVECDAFRARGRIGVKYDLVVANPPWKRQTVPPSAREYIGDRPVAGELAQAFMWLGADLAEGGRGALIVPSKWLFNAESPDVAFRRRFLASVEVQTVMNLSAVRGSKGRSLFAGATGPASVVVFRTPRASEPSEAILYVSPMPSREVPPTAAFLVEGPDLKWLPRAEAEERDDLWKPMMWGSWRDVRLLRRIRTRCRLTLADLILARGWKEGRGFQAGGDKEDEWIASLPEMSAKTLDHYVARVETLAPPRPELRFGRKGDPPEIYSKPHLLFVRGKSKGRFGAAYASFECSFTDTIVGVSAPIGDAPLLKAAAAYLTSDLANYLLFLTVGEWGVERDRIPKERVFALPAAPLEDERVVARLADLVDRIGVLPAGEERLAAKGRIEDELARVFRLTEDDRSLIDDLLWRDGASLADQESTVGDAALGEYVSRACAALARVSPRPWTGVVHTSSSNCPLRAVSIWLPRPGEAPGRVMARKDLDEVLNRLDRRLWSERSESLYVRRHLRLFDDSAVHIVKPAGCRWWLASEALRDADELYAEFLAGDGHAPR